ncbi:MAG: hypothetical protein BMS9Abin02_1906 [Anaerolineae bacterium]|nr:MAG: hypothetical protein BMS9Abin02_1906 [Anaerolineae bacterium]
MSHIFSRLLRIIWGAALIVIVSSCAKSPAATPTLTPTTEPVILHLGISQAAGRAGEIIENGFASAPGNIQIHILTGSNQTLLEDLDRGLLDAVVVHRTEGYSQLWHTPIAMDGLVFVASPENLFEEITVDEISSLFATGINHKIDKLNEDDVISIILPEPGSGILEIFKERVMGGRSISGAARIVPDSRLIPEVVQSEGNALGLTAMGVNDRNKALALEGILPLPDTVLDQSYPLSIPLYFVSKSEPNGELRRLLSWLHSDSGQSALGDFYGRLR